MDPKMWVAIIGAGPAGLFAARELAGQGVGVVLINRDIKPGGLAEYGIYPDKHLMKEGLRVQFRKVLASPGIYYFGNLEVGCHLGMCPDELLRLGFQAVLVAVGAQGTKFTGLPGENLKGVYHAKDLVYHYNHLPPYGAIQYAIGKKIAVIGAGNVSLDITHYLSSLPQVEDVYAIIRRGPGEVKFDQKELQYVACMVQPQDLANELVRVSPVMMDLGQEPSTFYEWVMNSVDKAGEPAPCGQFHMRFLLTPNVILGDENGQVCGLEVEDNVLIKDGEEIKVRRTGKKSVLDVDTVVFAIGDRVDERLGLPVVNNEYVKNSAPRFPVSGISYEVYDPVKQAPVEGIFVTGWAREASKGLVGVARRDGIMSSQAVLQYLKTCPEINENPLPRFQTLVESNGSTPITQADLTRLDTVEKERAAQLGLEEFKFDTNDEMLTAIGLLKTIP